MPAPQVKYTHLVSRRGDGVACSLAPTAQTWPRTIHVKDVDCPPCLEEHAFWKELDAKLAEIGSKKP